MEEKDSIFYSANPAMLITILFIGMLIFLKIGEWVGDKLRKKTGDNIESVNATIVGAVLALFAFLLGFTFSMSGGLFESRRLNTISEANAIGTALLRADLYPASTRDSFRMDFEEYIKARINYFQVGNNLKATLNADKRASDFAASIWKRASNEAVNTKAIFPGNLMLPALNAMMDSANANNYGEKFKVPAPIIFLLMAISLVCTFFVGYYTIHKNRFNKTMTICFCILSCLVIYTTLDLGSARSGFIKHQTSLRALTDLLKEFDHP